MDSFDADRIARLEDLVARLYRHLGLDPSVDFGRMGASSPGYPQPFSQPSVQPSVQPSAQPSAQPFPQDAVPDAGPSLPPSFYQALSSGRKIVAIKIYREATGVGLKQAKDVVDAMARNGGH